MALRIFEVDPAGRPGARYQDDIVGRFRSGMSRGRQAVALDKWRVTSGDPTVAARIAELYGGDPEEWETDSEERLQVFTGADEVNIILAGPSAVTSEMVLWGRAGLLRSCDGVSQRDENNSPCECPSTIKERKERAKAGTGCEPAIRVYFRLADDPELGKFRFQSGSWTMAAEIAEAEAALATIGGPALGTLALEHVEYTTKTGKDVAYTKPVLTIACAAPEPAAALPEAA
jgi:hypothetical protein